MPPPIAIVIPSLNQARFLRTALSSVLDQGQELECVVMDGGSTDGSVEILREHEARLTAWVSEPDRSPYHAVNKAVALTRAEIIGWINSDDAYVARALRIVTEIFARFPQIEWLTTLFPLHLDMAGRTVRADFAHGYNRDGFFSGEYLPRDGAFSLGGIQQESTFWRRSLWERIGSAIDLEFPIAGDYALWAQFFQHAELYAVSTPLGAFRFHGNQMITRDRPGFDDECARIVIKYGGCLPGTAHRRIRELGVRLPGWLQPAAAKLRLVRRANLVNWDFDSGQWTLGMRWV